MMPERIQLQRTKGWRMPPDTVKVDRSTRFGNPFKVGDDGVPDAATAVRLFDKLLQRTDIGGSDEFFIFTPERLRQDLGAMNLACWCPLDQPCHADVLLHISNSPPTQTEPEHE